MGKPGSGNEGDEASAGGAKKHGLEEVKPDEKVKKPKLEDNANPEEESDQGSEESESESDEELDIGEDDDDEQMEEGDLPENLIIDFEGVPPKPGDIEAVDALVAQVYRGLPISSLEISQLIVQNEGLSTLLKDEDLEDPATFAVSSVLNLSHPSEGLNSELAHTFRSMVIKGIEDQCEREKVVKDLPQVLQNFEISTERAPPTAIGLVVIEKMVNMPPQVVWRLLSTLREDMDYENQTFTHFMLMTKFYRVGDEVFAYEDYYEPFQNVSCASVDFPLPKDADTIPHNGKAGVPFRRLLVIPADGFHQAINMATAAEGT